MKLTTELTTNYFLHSEKISQSEMENFKFHFTQWIQNTGHSLSDVSQILNTGIFLLLLCFLLLAA